MTIDSFADYSNRTRMGYDITGSNSLHSILLSNITIYTISITITNSIKY